MAKIKTSFECSLCESQNHVDIKKPVSLGSIVSRQKCEVCDSSFLLKFTKIAGPEFNMRVDSIKVEPSPKGLEIYNENHPPKAEQPKEVKNGHEPDTSYP